MVKQNNKADADIIEKNDLLFGFIADKYRAYEEPERKGTPRGEKIGFSKNKYLASLFVALTKLKPKQLADELSEKYGLSHGLIRKWKTEDDFKEQARMNALEFAFYLVNYIEEKIDKDREKWNDYFNCKTDSKPANIDLSEIYEAARLLSPGVIFSLFKIMVIRAEESSGLSPDDLTNEAIIRHLVETIAWHAGGEEPSNKYYQVFKQLNIKIIKSIISSKRVLSKNEQRVIIHILETLEESTEEIEIG